MLLVTELASVLRRALESILLAIIIDEVPAAAAADDDTPVDESDVVGMDFIFVDVVATAAAVVVV